MGNMAVDVGAKEASIQATVVRCGCGDPLNVHPDSPCPKPRATEDLGTVSYWHKNPIRRWLWAARHPKRS